MAFSINLSATTFKLLSTVISLLSVSLGATIAEAQVNGDQTLPAGDNTMVTSADNTYTITGGAIRGNNLFHSFEKFSLSEGEAAFFDHANNINTILGRVTGGTVSSINGIIKTDPQISTADIFLVNPQGIIFGPSAALDIGGSFIASTAEKIVFADGVELRADDFQPAILTMSQPVGLTLGANSGSIVNESVIASFGLRVPKSETIALIGNGINLVGGRVTALSGRIELASLAPDSSVTLIPPDDVTGLSWILDYGNDVDHDFQDIRMSSQALLEASSDVSRIPNGSVQLRGRRIFIDNSKIFTLNYGDSKGGKVSIVASEHLALDNQSTISASTLSNGNSGGLIIDVSAGTVKLLTESLLTAQSGSSKGPETTGAAGDLTIHAANLIVQDGSLISTSSLNNGLGGKLIINTPNGVTEIVGISPDGKLSNLSAITRGAQDAGEIQINTRDLLVREGGAIQTGTFGSGNGGRTQINATESVIVVGELNGRVSQIYSSSESSSSSSNTGSVDISARRLLVENGAAIFTSTNSSGQGGDLTVRADETILSGQGTKQPSGLFARTENSGDSGRLTLITDSLLIEDGARFTVSTDEDATSDNLGTVRDANITARTITLNNGQITAESLSGNGGNLNLTVQDAILLRNNSLISATAGTAESGGDGGNVNINMPDGFIIAIPDENSDIVANAFSGTGGNINITTQNIIGLEARPAFPVNTTNDIDASSRFGASGNISINDLDLDLTQGLIELPTEPTEPNQVAQRCAIDSGQQSTFVDTRQGGRPPTPREVVRNEATTLVDLDSGINNNDVVSSIPEQNNTLATNDSAEQPLVEAQGWYRNKAGTVTLISQEPTANVVINTHPQPCAELGRE